jgi:hypothetical protein
MRRYINSTFPLSTSERRFQVNNLVPEALQQRTDRIHERLRRDSWPETDGPVLSSRPPKYEVSERVLATNAGGIGKIHRMVTELGIPNALNAELHLLKFHMPYHESDHILTMVYNTMAGGQCLDDLKDRRNDEALLNMLGAVRIPDSSTAGDFLRRFKPYHIEQVMTVINNQRIPLWKMQPAAFRECAYIDADGTITPTDGEKKYGMDLSHKGEWGYGPLVVSLANTQEPLFILNRPANRPSHEGAAAYLSRAAELCKGAKFKKILMRGDTDFSQTRYLDGWDQEGYYFVFGYDAAQNLKIQADLIPDEDWKPLRRLPKNTPTTGPRNKRPNVKDQIVIERGYKTIRTVGESVSEIVYRPSACEKSYRMVILRKDLAIERGEPTLIPNEVKYFFYITNDETLSAAEVVFHANARCHQENLIEQLKNGVRAFRTPMHDLDSNWAYMVIVSLAWTFKSWFGLLQRKRTDRVEVLRMEFRRFLNQVVCIPSQVVRHARGIRVRLLAFTKYARLMFERLNAPTPCR